MTWEELTKLEPKLIDLEKRVMENRPNNTFKWNDEYKPAIRKIVGFNRKEGPEELKTHNAHNTVYFHILDLIVGDLEEEEAEKLRKEYEDYLD